jgi:hypothetical protein
VSSASAAHAEGDAVERELVAAGDGPDGRDLAVGRDGDQRRFRRDETGGIAVDGEALGGRRARAGGQYGQRTGRAV